MSWARGTEGWLVAMLLASSTALAQDPELAPAPLPAVVRQGTPPALPAPRPDAGPAAPGKVPPPPPRELPPILGAEKSVGGPLGLDEVLDSVEQNYPLLRAIEQERVLAGGKVVTAMGAFDLNLNASADGTSPATYDSIRSSLGFNQALPNGGMGIFAGYRNGYGEFPTYNLGQKTADGGELRAGIVIPLLRDRAIDRPRAGLQQARLDVQIAEPTIERQRLDFLRAATRVYWNWVASGQRLRIASNLLKLAVDRDEQLKARVEAGPVANIERIDNQQNIALRNGLLVQAQRGFQQSTIDLSLFLRDNTGSPTLAGPDRLPAFPLVQSVSVSLMDDAIDRAMQMRPEPLRLRLQREKAVVDYRLATNQMMQSVNALVGGSQDLGFSKSPLSGPNGLDRSNLNASILYNFPVQQREARGRVLQAQALIAQADQQLRNAEDVVRAEVQDTFSALERAYEFFIQAKNRVELVRLVAEAEREQLRLGRSDILRVTLREQAAFDAELLEIGAQQDYFRAQADFRFAQGIGNR